MVIGSENAIHIAKYTAPLKRVVTFSLFDVQVNFQFCFKYVENKKCEGGGGEFV